MVHAVRSSLRGETRRQSREIVTLRWRAAVAAVCAVAVVVSIVASAVLRRAVVAGGEVDALTV